MDRLMWTPTTRAEHRRERLRFASDVTDAGWAVLEPLLPLPAAVGRPPAWPMREIVNAIFYVLRGGIPWRMLPDCCPPRQTVYGWFLAFRERGVWESVNHHLVMADRERAGREASPTAAVIDSQSVKTSDIIRVNRGILAQRSAPPPCASERRWSRAASTGRCSRR